jgi:hypothetical protein
LVPDAPTDQVMPADWPEAEKPNYKVVVPEGTPSKSAGIAVGANKVYVADRGVPLIHVVDFADPCRPLEQDPLRPLDFENPTRAVVTSEVAVSDVTLAGQAKHQRFLYAVDWGTRSGKYDTVVTSTSIIAFDLSDGASKTPILRAHVPELPFDPPDRIRFESPIKKLQIVTHDAPVIDPSTKTSELGLLCNPYPNADDIGTLYRTSADFATGAGPRKLRGIFGVVTLSTGQISAIDIEDWDAPCRRPKSNTPVDGTVDWLGCTQDKTLAAEGSSWFTEGGTDAANPPTVTDESSCNVIEPHRLRSGRFFRTDSTLGTLAPSLSAYPRLSSLEGGDLPTGKNDLERKHPQMLAVPFSAPDDLKATPAFLNVGTTRYEQTAVEQDIIETEPGSAQYNSLLLPLKEPRVYYGAEAFSATYEGVVIAERGNGWLPRYPGTAAEATEILLNDPDAQFCANGVEAYDVARKTGVDSFRLSDPVLLERFAADHADFVVFTEDFVSTDPYWAAAANQAGYCPETADPYKTCVSWFGTRKDKKPTREFTIREARSGDLVIVPRDVVDSELWVARARCCFHDVAPYEVRAGKQWVVKGNSILSHMRSDGNNQVCVKDSSVRRSKLRSRAFEISSKASACTSKDAAGKLLSKDCAIGAYDPNTDVCVTDQASRGVLPTDFASGVLPPDCLYDGLKGRFAIYRGQQPSVRDMAFKWTVTGGFSPLTASIASATVGLNVLPMDMVYSESMEAFVIVDGASGGLNLVGVAGFTAIGQPYL